MRLALFFVSANMLSRFPTYRTENLISEFDTWADTMDLLMAFEPEVLGPGHTRPVFGASEIRSVLSDYRDAIRHIVTATR